MNQTHGVHVYPDDVLKAAEFYVNMAFELCGRGRADLVSRP